MTWQSESVLVLNSVTSTPQWIRQPEAAWCNRSAAEMPWLNVIEIEMSVAEREMT